jgi:hypothetical protein
VALITRKCEVACNTATGSQTISPPGGDPGLGAPKAALFWGVALTADGVGIHNRFFAGVATPDGGDGNMAFVNDDGAATMVGGGNLNTDAAVKIYTSATTPTLDAAATVSAWNSDGSITLNWSDAPSSAWRLHVLLFYGDSITNAKAGSDTFPASAGSKAHTGVGFQPDFVLKITAATSTLGTRNNGSHLSIGMITAAGQAALGFAVGETANAQNVIGQRADRSWYAPSTSGSALWDATRTSMDSDGWTENYATSAGAAHFIYLALKGGDYYVGSDQSPTAAGVDSVTAPGFAPGGVLLASWGQGSDPAFDTASADNARLSIGAADSAGNEGHVWLGHDDGAASSDANMRTSATKALSIASDFAGTVAAEADVAMTSTGFDATWTADGTAREVIYAAFGPTTVGPQTVVPGFLVSPSTIGQPTVTGGATPTYEAEGGWDEGLTGTSSTAILQGVWNGYQAAETYSIEVQTTETDGSSAAARFEIQNGDNPIGFGDRAEVQQPTFESEGVERWYAWSTKLDSTWPTFPSDGSIFQVISQWHSSGDGPPPVSVNLYGDAFGLQINYSPDGSATETMIPWTKAFTRGQWYRFRFHITWSDDDAIGELELWVDGVKQTFNYPFGDLGASAGTPGSGTQVLPIRTLRPGQDAYFKQGIYQTTNEIPGAAGTPAIIYHDNWRRATSDPGDDPPGGSSEQTVVPDAVATPSSVGSPTVTPGAVTVVPGAVATPSSVGSPTVTPGSVTVVPTQVASPASAGAPTVTPGAVTVRPGRLVASDAIAYSDGNLVGQGDWIASVWGDGDAQVASGQIATGAADGQWRGGDLATFRGYGSVAVTVATPSTGSNQVEVYYLIDAPNRTMAALGFDGDEVYLGRYIGGAWTRQVTVAYTVQAGDRLTLDVDATTSRAYLNGQLIATATHGLPNSSGRVGFDTQSASVRLDDVVVVEAQPVASPSTVEAPTVLQVVEPAQVASPATVEAPTVTPGPVTVEPSQVASPASVGEPAATPGPVTVEPAEVASGAQVGEPAITTAEVVIIPDEVPSPATVGEPTVIGDQYVTTDPVASPSSVGQPGLVYDQAVAADQVASPASVGEPTVTPGSVTVVPTHVATPSSAGQPTVTPGAVTVEPSQVASPSSVGQPGAIIDQFVIPQAVASPATVGEPGVGDVVSYVEPETVPSAASVGQPAVSQGRNPAIYARGPRELAADVRLKGPDGYWIEVGKGVARGITVEGLTLTANRKGPDTCSFTLRRDPTRPWPEFAAFNRGEVVIGGERLWAGRLKEAPGQTGSEQTISFSGEGRQSEQDDDLVSIGFVHQRLDDWQDVRTVTEANLSTAYAWPQAPTVSTEYGQIIIGYPNATPYVQSNGVGVRLDLGEYHSRAEEVAVECIAVNPNPFAGVYVRGHNSPDALSAAVQGVDWDDYYTGGLSFNSISSDEANPTIIRGVLSPGYRYISIFMWTNPTPGGTTGMDHLLKIRRVAVSSSMTYLDDTEGKSVLRASDVIGYLVASGRIGPNLSRSLDEIETSGLIDGSTYGIPDLWLGASSPRELVDAVNAYHDYLSGVDPDGRVFFKAPPATPDLEVGSWAGAEFNDASASSAADVYTKAIGEATGADGQPLIVTRHAVQASPELVQRSDVALLSNPSFTTNTTGWGATVGSIARVTTDTYDGGGAGEVSTAASGRTATVEANLTGLTIGRTYAVLVPAKKGTTVPEPSYEWYAQILGIGGVILDRVADPVQGDTYRDHYLTFTADATTATLEIGATIAEAAPGATVAFYIDGLRTFISEVNAADRAGVPRATRIPIGAAMTRASLETLLDVWLRNHLSTPLKGSLRVTGQGGVRRHRGGTGVPAHELLLYPGRLIWLSNVEDPDSGAWGRSGTIASVTYSHDDRSATVEIDNERRRFDTFVSRIAALVDQVR